MTYVEGKSMAKRKGISAPVPQQQQEATDHIPARRSAVTAAIPTERGRLCIEGAGGRWLLDGTRLTIGRAQGGVGANVEIAHDTVSRRHAELVATPDGWEIRDLGSVNGTRVDGVMIGRGEGVSVGEGQIVRVGGAELRVVRR